MNKKIINLEEKYKETNKSSQLLIDKINKTNEEIIDLEEKYKEIQLIKFNLSKSISDIEYHLALKYFIMTYNKLWYKDNQFKIPLPLDDNENIDIEKIYSSFCKLSYKKNWKNVNIAGITIVINDNAKTGRIMPWERYTLFRIFGFDTILYNICKEANYKRINYHDSPSMFQDIGKSLNKKLFGYFDYINGPIDPRRGVHEETTKITLKKIYDNYVNKIKEELGYD
jgi:hypothetical protein